ncbi:DUF6457 domain-containing protein [Corynebacterium uberis]|uniref:DUF6457 domain-containing protein n=1 Tax=Corynebacterium TaxID=1716 RepID=UPI001D0B6147|nr:MULTISPECIES: DUF6457 domain-containing protein [Corynebacterium]MCZ9309390.1 DUF6457 domain-containing protein [Corynebacterium sp. c6VSa_13]UDL72939.1 DUF6457 domain-containing protein [Corynebacterium uberis]UDL76184.1 DUF6457 domain-containing protein [Corynebacterium uberis]UDL78396.1 DUF6457 domain-containing protein [Corynebacterium uberis]UDL80679.1 DUF6457 domain-containing protein [Corynebacterium uberis]
MTEPDRSAHGWLTAAAQALELDPRVVTQLTGELLDLTRDVAHGPSRPAAPLTAFLVGLATGRGTSAVDSPQATADAARDRITHIRRLVADYTDPQDS